MDHDRTIYGWIGELACTGRRPAERIFCDAKRKFFFVIKIRAALWGGLRPAAENGTRAACAPQNLHKKSSRVRLLDLRDLFRRSGGDYVPAFIACFRTKIDNPIGALDHFEVMLDHNDRMTAIDQPLK